MNKSYPQKKKKKGRSTLYFLAVALVTAAIVVITIKEGDRVREENELLSYEVW